VEAWIGHLLAPGHGGGAPSVRSSSWFKWLEGEEELNRSPMATMKPPTVPASPVPVLGDDQLTALLRVCEGKGFEDRRDAALVRTLLDTGSRLAEVAGLAVADVDFGHDVVHLLGKGSRPRACPFERRTSHALDR